MGVVSGARIRPAPYTTSSTIVQLGTRLGEKQVCPEVQALELPGSTLRVDGSGRAPNDSPFRTCSWAVVGRGVLVRAKLTGPAQSVYRAELLALVTALQGSLGQRLTLLLSLTVKAPADWWKSSGLASESHVELGREVKWTKAHTGSRTAALHGVSEADRLGNDRADKAANEVLAAVDGRQDLWNRYRAFASKFRTLLGLIGPTLSERKEKLLVRPQLSCEETQ
eukprot:981837-Amphidinium_carterae.1